MRCGGVGGGKEKRGVVLRATPHIWVRWVTISKSICCNNLACSRCGRESHTSSENDPRLGANVQLGALESSKGPSISNCSPGSGDVFCRVPRN